MSAVPIAILGGGALGCGLADAAARGGRDVILWSEHPQHEGSERVRVTERLIDTVEAELLIFALPSPFVPEVASALCEHLDGAHFLVHTSRGMIGNDLRTLTQVLRHLTPCRRIGALAGPVLAQTKALREGEPCAAVIGTRFPGVSATVRDVFSGQNVHVYKTDDVLGVELAATVVGLLSLVIGYGAASGLGTGTLAMIITRGMAEAARLGAKLGARAETFHGLAGVGDLFGAFAGDGRPELEVGRKLAEGTAVEAFGTERGAHIEVFQAARWTARQVERTGLHAPVLNITVDVFRGRLSPREGLAALMAMEVGGE